MDGGNPAYTPSLVPLRVLAALQHNAAGCALRFRTLSVTAATLHGKVLALAALLQQQGIGPHSRIGVCLGRSPETLVALLALWCCRAVYVPLDPALPRQRLLSMVDGAALQLLLATPAQRLQLTTLPCPVLALGAIDFDRSVATPAAASALPGLPEDLACILFTSGSTGTPKALAITHANLAALFAAILPLLALPPQPRILACASFGFDIALFELLAPLLCGGSVILADDDCVHDPALLARLIDSEQIDVVQATPTRWDLLVRCAWNTEGRAIVAIATGEALPRNTARILLERTAALWNLYGPAECTLWASAHRVLADDIGAGAPAVVCIGKALPGYRLLLDSAGTVRLASAGQEGELLIAGSGVSPGYCKQPQLNAQVFSTAMASDSTPLRCYRSGDLCRVDTAGRLHFLGRRDQQVKHNGHRIELDEISLQLRGHASLQEAVCLLRPATALHSALLFACVVLRPGVPNRNQRQLNEWLAANLPDWMLPQRYFFLPALPQNANGKLDRAALLELAAPACAVPVAANIPATLELQVARIFCEVLELDSIGPCDSFLDAGGSSMLSATLVLALNNQLGCNLSLRQVLATPPTVSSVVSLLAHSAPRATAH